MTLALRRLVPGLASTAWLVALASASAAPLTGGEAAHAAAGRGEGTAASAAGRRPAARLGLSGSYAVHADGRVSVMVELAEPSTVETYAQRLAVGTLAAGRPAAPQATAAAQAQLAHLENVQRGMVEILTSAGIGANVLYRVQRVYDGIAIEVDATRLDDVRSLPGVRAVHPLIPKTFENATSVPFIGAPEVWSSSGANATGTGIKVGVIDTGIDYLHKDFGGSANYPANGIYTSPNWPTNAKVVGGTDFAGDAYDAGASQPANRQPQPDPDPMDCNGHGSHVAGTIAGYGVTASGDTFAGPWGPGTPFSSLKIGPGVAPGAQLYALRVFGCSGSTSLVTQAIDWAVDPNGDGDFSDHLDVINMSLGSSYGGSDDPDAVAADRAALAGVLVVAAAGNSGDGYFITGSPGTSSRTLSVAASADSGVTGANLHVNSPSAVAGDYTAEPAAFGPPLPDTPITSDVVYAAPNDGCASLTNAAAVSGKVAFIDRGACNFTVKVENAQLAGAAAVVVANNTGGDALIIMSGSDPTITIPSVFISQNDGNRLKAQFPSAGVNASLVKLNLADQVADFSSRGPRLDGAALKPDITAPGVSIVSVKARSGSDSATYSGTSMASPHLAGTMALLRQLHPAWTVEELKALAMNTASHPVYLNPNLTPPIVGLGRTGAGRVDVAAAASAPAVAFCADDPGEVSVSFGVVEVLGATSLTKNVKVVNKSSSPLSYDLGFTPVTSVPGVTIALPGGTSLSVPAGGSATFQVRLSATAALLKHSRDASVSPTSDQQPRSWLAEEGGLVTLTPVSGPALRVPVYAVVRPASAMTTREERLAFPSVVGTVTIDLAGQGLANGTSFPTDELSLVSALELQEANPDPTTSDLRYLGVASDYQAQVAAGHGLADSTIYFGMALTNGWSTPNELGFKIMIDVNQDGIDDYSLFETDYITGDDVFLAALCPVAGGTCRGLPLNGVSPAALDTVPFATNVLVLPVKASDLGLTDANSRFNFYFKGTSHNVLHSFDPAHPGMWFGGTSALSGSSQPIFPDLDGGSIVVHFDPAGYQKDAGLGVLLLHHHNGSGEHAQVVSTNGPPPRRHLHH